MIATAVHTTALLLLSTVAAPPRRVRSEMDDAQTVVTVEALTTAPEPALPPPSEPPPPAPAGILRRHRPAARLLVTTAPHWGDPEPLAVAPSSLPDPAPPPASPPPAPPSLPRATYVAPAVARALRAYDTYPSMSDAIPDRPFRQPTSIAPSTAATLDICVSSSGAVTGVSVSGPNEAFNRRLRPAVLTWRYRPLLVAGAPAPFCHLMKIAYDDGHR
jgi:hypothetical protein